MITDKPPFVNDAAAQAHLAEHIANVKEAQRIQHLRQALPSKGLNRALVTLTSGGKASVVYVTPIDAATYKLVGNVTCQQMGDAVSNMWR